VLLLLAVPLGRWWDAPPFGRVEWSWGGLAAGIAATAPLLVALRWGLATRWPPAVRFARMVEERIAPLFAEARPADLVLLALLAGVAEEALFRGVIQGALQARLPAAPAIVLAALLFGVAHWISATYAVLATLVAVYLGVLLELSGNLLAPMVTHALYDAVALALLARVKPDPAPFVRGTASSASRQHAPDSPARRPPGPGASLAPSRSGTRGGPMTVVDTYAPGRFCWTDLGTSDPADAKRFYTGLFGWTIEDRPMGNGAVYTMLFSGGRSVAALYQQDPQQQAMGIPPNWLSYISVESADRSAELARTLGGTVLMDAFDVLDVGRMAMIQDPTGAVVALWEARTHHGAGVIEEPNTLAWNELETGDTPRAATFYTGLLGWTAEASRYGETDYTVFRQGEGMAGGMMAIPAEWGPVPPHWLVYFAVNDCDAAAAEATRLGGTVTSPPMDISGVGRFAVIRDPQGAVFAVIRFTDS